MSNLMMLAQSDSSSSKSAVTAVIPCFNSGAGLGQLVSDLGSLGSKKWKIDEIILVDDSSDRVFREIYDTLRLSSPKVKVVRLRKNVGQHLATAIGALGSTNPWIVTLDDDGQNPPFEVPRLLELASEKDLDLVYGIPARKNQSVYRRLSGRIFRMVMTKISGDSAFRYQSNFRCFRRDLLEGLHAEDFLSSSVDTVLLARTGKTSFLSVTHAASGKPSSGYSFRKLLKLARVIVLANLGRLLGRVIELSVGLSSLLMISAAVVLALTLTNEDREPGIAFLASIILGSTGILTLITSVLGLYIARLGAIAPRNLPVVLRD